MSKATPVDLGDFHGTGGTLAIEGCGYSVTTREGAEPPAKGIDLIGPDPTPKLVHLGIIGDPKTSVVAVWRTNDELTARFDDPVRGGRSTCSRPISTQEARASCSAINPAAATASQHVYPVHQGHLCGLRAGHRPTAIKSVRIDPFTKASTSRRSTRSTPRPISSRTRMPRSCSGSSAIRAAATTSGPRCIQQLSARTPDIVLFSGDAVTLGITQPEWEDFFGRAEPLFATTPMISAHGNHEANAINYYSQMALPGDEQNYGIDYGYAHITVANDTPEDPNAITGAFRDALQSDFAASQSARWKIFMHHQPMWSASTRHGSSLTLQQAWQPLVDQYGIDLVLNGHDHDYEVTLPMLGAATQPSTATGTVYIVAGSAGAELYDNGTDFWTAYSEKTYSAATIHVRRDRMTFSGFPAGRHGDSDWFRQVEAVIRALVIVAVVASVATVHAGDDHGERVSCCGGSRRGRRCGSDRRARGDRRGAAGDALE